ncbi:MAG TPA: hypothetical protein PLC98_11790 [Anaerolineales bacterium]|nr:hypothetical protein [Anaerolineales bacterium]
MSWLERLRAFARADGVGRWLGLVPPVLFFALSVVDLNRLPLWWDEGGSLDFLDRPLSAIAALDTHPPGYHLLLLVWTHLLGREPFVARMLSALTGTLAVALFGWAATRWTEDGGRRNVARMLLLATSPFLLHYAREVRMYGLAIALTALSLGLLAPLLSWPTPRRRVWIGYTLTLIVGLYVHLGFAAVGAAQALGVALSLRRWPGRWRGWVGVGLGVIVGVIPWVYMLVSTSAVLLADTRLEAGARVNVLATSLEVLRQIAAGPSAMGGLLGWTPFVTLGGLALVGVWALRRRPAAVVVLVGLIFFGVVGAARINYGLADEIAVAARLGFGALPGLIMLAALGLEQLRPQLRWILVVVLIGLSGPGLGRVLGQPIDTAEDFRPIIAHLRNVGKPGDAVLYTFRWQNGDLGSYWPDHEFDPVLRLYDRGDVAVYVKRLEAGHDRVWLLNYGTTWGDPSDAIYPELEARGAIAERLTLGATEVVLFAFVPSLSDPSPAYRPLGPATVGFAPVADEARPGDVLPVRVRWQDAPAGFNTFLHLGASDNAPIAQSDSAVAALPAGELAAALLIPPDALPGRYALYVGLYDPATGARLPVPAPSGCDTPDRLCLGTVDVVR